MSEPVNESSEQPGFARFSVEVHGDDLGDEDLLAVHAHLNGELRGSSSNHVGVRLVGIWNTGLTKIANGGALSGGLFSPFFLVDGESQGHSIRVATGGVPEPFQNVIFPWCSSWSEVRTKAFRVYRGPDTTSPLQTYIFQNYRSSMVEYAQAEETVFEQPFGGHRPFDRPASYLSLELANGPDGYQCIVIGAGGPFGPVGGFHN